jgi:hypothetical protein
VLSTYQVKELLPYQVGAVVPHHRADWGYPNDVERLGVEFAAQVRIQHNPQVIVITYEVYVRGSQCGVFRHLFRPKPNPRQPKHEHPAWDAIGAWECILWYEGLSNPESTVIADDFKACLLEAMQMIEREVVQ